MWRLYILFLAKLAPQQLAEATTAATNVVCNGCVGTSDIADNSIYSVDIRNGQVATADIQDRTIRRGDVAVGALSPSIILRFSDGEEIPAGETGEESILCPTGYRATGGGFSVSSPGLQVLDSFPVQGISDGPPAGWRVEAEASTAADEVLSASVICIGPIPP